MWRLAWIMDTPSIESYLQLAKDFPSVPLWFRTATVGWSDHLATVKINAR